MTSIVSDDQHFKDYQSNSQPTVPVNIDIWKNLHQRIGTECIIDDKSFVINDILKSTEHTRVCKCFGTGNEEYVVKAIRDNPNGDPYDYQLGEIEYAKTVDKLFDSSVLTYEIAKKINDVAVIVSKYRGISLANYRKENQQLLLCEVLQILIRVSHALNLLHGKGIIHSDIKPDNMFVFVTETECNIPALSLTLGDLGIAHSMNTLPDASIVESLIDDDIYALHMDDDDDDDYTNSTYFRGTKGFIAPECLEQHTQSFKSDVWSLGRSILLLLFPQTENSTIQKHLDDIQNSIMNMDLNEDNKIIKLIDKGNLENDVAGWRQIIILLIGMLDQQPENRLSCEQVLKTIFPNGTRVGLVTLEAQFSRLHEDFVNNDNLQLLCLSLGVVDYYLMNLSNREIVLSIVKRCGEYIECADEKFKKDREIMLEVVKHKYQLFKHVDESLKMDRDFILQAAKRNTLCLEYVDEIFTNDRELILQAIQQNGLALMYASETLKKDREFVLKAIQLNGDALFCVEKMFKKDRELVLEAVTQNGKALHFAKKIFKNDREIVLKAIQQDGEALEYADETLRKDREIVLQAVTKNGNALRFADEIFKKDREIVLQAVTHTSGALKFADEETRVLLQNELDKHNTVSTAHQLSLDYSMIHKSLQQPKTSVAPTYYKKDKAFMLETVKQNLRSLGHADESLKMDREFILQAVSEKGEALQYADKELKKDREIVLQAIQQEGRALRFADESFRIDREIVLKAIKHDRWEYVNGSAFEYAHETLKEDREFVLQALQHHGQLLELTSENFRKDKELVLIAIKKSHRVFKYADESLKKDGEFILEAVKFSHEIFEFVDESFKKDREFLLQAIQNNRGVLFFADETFRKERISITSH